VGVGSSHASLRLLLLQRVRFVDELSSLVGPSAIHSGSKPRASSSTMLVLVSSSSSVSSA